MESEAAQLVPTAPAAVRRGPPRRRRVPGPLLGQHPHRICQRPAGWFAWCAQVGLEPFAVLRVHIELYARWMEEERHLARATIGRRLSTVVGFYRFAVIDGFRRFGNERGLTIPGA
jgi:hypothetical protein